MSTQTIRIKLPKPHQAQREIINHPARFKVVTCGRRFGKTQLSQILLIDQMIHGYPTAYFAPTYKMGAEVWRALKKTLQPLNPYKNEVERRIELFTGGSIDFWSLDSADSVRGRKYKYIVIDEAALIPSMDTWTDVLRPLLADFQGGALFPSTPRGLNWYFQIYTRGLDKNFPDWKSFQFPTSANPFINPDEIEDARATLPERSFQQEYLADFTEDSGAVFRRVDECSTLKPQPPNSERRYIGGIDWGKTGDFTVLTIIDAETKQQVFIDRFNMVSWEIQRGRVRSAHDQYKVDVWFAENNSIGDVNIEALQADGIPIQPFRTSAQSKTPLIDGLALAMERREISLLDDTIQKMELKAYTLERLPSGMYRYNAPSGMNDDTVIALALAWHGANKPKRLSWGELNSW